jgi:hypothetical protein
MAASSSVVPRGKGFFLRDLDGLPGPGHTARILHNTGIRFVVPAATYRDQGLMNSLRQLGLYAAAFRDYGIESWPFAWFPYPRVIDSALGDMVAAARAMHARGMVLNVELEYKNEPAAAERLARSAERVCDDHGWGLGISSYSLPSHHPTFPWAQFAQVGWGSPQTYDKDHRYGPGHVARGIAQWRELGFRYIAPGLNAWNKDRSPEGMARYLATVPAGTPGAVFWPGDLHIPRQSIMAPIAQWTGVDPRWYEKLYELLVGGNPMTTEVFNRARASWGA